MGILQRLAVHKRKLSKPLDRKRFGVGPGAFAHHAVQRVEGQQRCQW